MGRLVRIDAELVRRHLARSRAQAGEMIKAGRVKLDGEVVFKPARQMDPAQALVVKEADQVEYASRGAHKLLGALQYLSNQGMAIAIEGKICLDAGASTGGFTDVLLRHGAQRVYAVDVGYGQLAWQIRSNPAVVAVERTNIRYLTREIIPEAPELIVGDLSFISLTLLLEPLIGVADRRAEYCLMVKPQFEIGKDRLGAGGVVRDTADHIETVEKVARCAQDLGMQIHAVAPSPLPGPAGNVEYFLYFSAANDRLPDLRGEDLHQACIQAVAQGPAGGEWENRGEAGQTSTAKSKTEEGEGPR